MTYIVSSGALNSTHSLTPISVRVGTLNTCSGGWCWGCQKSFRGEHPLCDSSLEFIIYNICEHVIDIRLRFRPNISLNLRQSFGFGRRFIATFSRTFGFGQSCNFYIRSTTTEKTVSWYLSCRRVNPTKTRLKSYLLWLFHFCIYPTQHFQLSD